MSTVLSQQKSFMRKQGQKGGAYAQFGGFPFLSDFLA